MANRHNPITHVISWPLKRLRNVAAIRLSVQLALINSHGMEQMCRAADAAACQNTESRPLVDQAAKELLFPHAAELAFNILFCLFSICH